MSILVKRSLALNYRSPTKIPNRDKKTESPYLVHPLTYRQVYLTKDAYFVEKIHCELVEMAVGQRMNKIRFSCHEIYWFGFLVTIRNFRRAPVAFHFWQFVFLTSEPIILSRNISTVGVRIVEIFTQEASRRSKFYSPNQQNSN